MTNSPPVNINEGYDEVIRVLTSGIDSLTLSYYLEWKDTAALAALGEFKVAAGCSSDPVIATWESGNSADRLVVSVAGHGARGYPFLLTCGEYALKVGDWITPIMRPSVVVEFRSETLHRMGVGEAVERMDRLLRWAGAEIRRVVVSRVDVFADVLIPEELWKRSMEDLFVTRARDIGTFSSNKAFSGFTVGRGQLSCRLYDKPLEIASKSGKLWMYKEWKLDSVPAGYRIIRVEFRLGGRKSRPWGSIATLTWWLKPEVCGRILRAVGSR